MLIINNGPLPMILSRSGVISTTAPGETTDVTVEEFRNICKVFQVAPVQSEEKDGKPVKEEVAEVIARDTRDEPRETVKGKSSAKKKNKK